MSYLIVEHVRRDAESATTKTAPVEIARSVDQAHVGVDLVGEIGDARHVLFPLPLEPLRIARVKPVIVSTDKGPGVVGIAGEG